MSETDDSTETAVGQCEWDGCEQEAVERVEIRHSDFENVCDYCRKHAWAVNNPSLAAGEDLD